MTRVLLLGAAAIAVVHVVLEAMGGRDLVSVLSGTLPPDGVSVVLGLGYAASRFALVVLAPILVLAAGLDAVASRIGRRRRKKGRGVARLDLHASRAHASLPAHESEPEDRGAGRER